MHTYTILPFFTISTNHFSLNLVFFSPNTDLTKFNLFISPRCEMNLPHARSTVFCSFVWCPHWRPYSPRPRTPERTQRRP